LKILLSVNLQIIFFIIFGRFDTTMKSIQDRNGVCFMFTVYLVFFSYNNAIEIFCTEKALYIRESLNNSYSCGAYFLS